MEPNQALDIVRALAAGTDPATGKPWTPEEDQALVAAFDSGSTPKQLAAAHERTNGAVRSRLMKLGKLDVR